MAKLTDELVERYLDGELKPRKARAVEKLLETSAEHRETLETVGQIGDLLRLMNEENLKDVSFEGLGARLDREIRADERPSRLSRARVWVAEFLENRRGVWVPAAAAVGALALVLILLPRGPEGSQGGLTSRNADDGIQLHTSSQPFMSRIDSVDFGDLTGAQYSIDDDRGGKIGVVWINESP
jgi:ferric-dicitrate binding protein FerR (iron transport regulator)